MLAVTVVASDLVNHSSCLCHTVPVVGRGSVGSNH
jgi:hypothetical protein